MGNAAMIMDENLIISVILFSSAYPPATVLAWLALAELLINMLRNTKGRGAFSGEGR